jgi:fucose permease
MKLKTFPIFMAFLVMGVADAMGPMSDAVKTQYELSNVMATMLSFFVFIAFAVFSVPGGLLAARIGMKKLLLLGLGLNAVAMLVPSLIEPGFALLLICIFVLGIGTTFLQVAGNPIMRDVSGEGAYSRNLSFAQGIKGLGSTVATYLVTAITAIALFQNMGWRGTFPIFFVLMAAAFVFVSMVKVEERKPETPPSIGSSLRLLKEPVFALAVLGIFLYVGAEVCMARFLFPGLKAIGLDEATAGKFGPALFFALLTVGRIAGGVLLTKVKPRPAFRISALMGAVGAGLIMTGNGALAIAGVILGGLGFANIWPLLFSITVEEKPERAGELSGLMCMAISGGAIVPLVMGGLVDAGMNAVSFVVPLVCFIYLFILSLKGGKVTA